jgi:hypothetical protein
MSMRAIALGFCLVFLLLSVPEARAHTMPGGLTLLQLCRAADVIAVARIARVGPEPKGAAGLPPVEAEILELVRGGDAKRGKISFAPHRHADENYSPGEEVFLFLERKKGADTAHEAVEAIADRIVLEPANRAAWIDAVKAYAALGKGPRAQTDAAALGRVTVQMLSSGEGRIASLALRDLTLAGDMPLLAAADAPALLALVDDPARPAALRVGLLMELERRKLVPVGARWAELLRTARPADRTTIVRATASRWFVPEVTAELVGVLERSEGETAVAAARALGGEGNEAAVPALVAAVRREPAELRYVALGSLRRVASAAAREEISRAATSHPDAETRRVAATEQNLLPPAPRASAPPRAPPAPAPGSAPPGFFTWIVVGVAVVIGAGALVVSALRRGKPD